MQLSLVLLMNTVIDFLRYLETFTFFQLLRTNALRGKYVPMYVRFLNTYLQ